MRRSYVMLAMLGVLAMTVGGMILAQSEASTVSGTVVSASGTSLVVRTDDNVQMSFKLDGSSILPDRMEPGERVTVSYHILEGGMYHAANVTAVSTGTPNTATTPTGTTAEYGQPAATGANENMPRTASPLPLLALIGVLSVISAIGLRTLSRRGA